jgi:GPH family glycoside/pentoside/hexuronide:cation symporter
VHEPHRRVWFFAIRTTVGLLGTVFLALVPGLVEVIQADGAEALFAWRMLLTILLAISTLLMLPSVFLIKETDYVAAAPADHQRIGIWKSVKTTLAVKPFRNFVIGTLFFSSATGVTNAAMLFYVDVLFGLPGSMSTVLLLVMIVAAFAFFPIVMPVARRVGKRKMLILTTIVCAVGYLLLVLYEPLGALLGAAPVGENSILTPMAGADAQSGYVYLIIILGVVFGLPVAVANLLGGSVYTDIIQYHKIRTGQTLSAMFTAAQNIILALPSTIIPAAVGILIYLGTTNEYPTTLGVQSTAILAIVVSIPALIFYRIYNEREILATIEAAAAQGEVDASETDVQS